MREREKENVVDSHVSHINSNVKTAMRHNKNTREKKRERDVPPD